jgi:hypothetical protein
MGDNKAESGEKRKRNESDEPGDAHKPPAVSAVTYDCLLCNVTKMTEKIYGRHLEGSKHAKKLAQSNNPQPTFACEICNVTGLIQASYQDHLQGKKHQKKLQPPDPSQIPDKACAICNVKGLTEGQLQMHLEGKRHKKATEAPEQPVTFECKTCGITFHQQQQLDEHSNGQKHKKKAESGEAPVPPPPRIQEDCKLCGVKLGSEIQKQQHFTGKKHRRNSIKSDPSSAEAPTPVALKPDLPMASQENLWPYRCAQCQKRFNGEASLMSHLSGRKHINRVKQLERNGQAMAAQAEAAAAVPTPSPIPGPQASPAPAAPQDAKSRLFTCDVCNVTLGAVPMAAHLRGKKHLRKAGGAAAATPPPTAPVAAMS